MGEWHAKNHRHFINLICNNFFVQRVLASLFIIFFYLVCKKMWNEDLSSISQYIWSLDFCLRSRQVFMRNFRLLCLLPFNFVLPTSTEQKKKKNKNENPYKKFRARTQSWKKNEPDCLCLTRILNWWWRRRRLWRTWRLSIEMQPEELWLNSSKNRWQKSR